MKRIYKCILILVSIVCCSVFVNSLPSSALTFSSSADIGFTFNSTLQMTLSSADLIIADLAPGETEDSDTITVSVNTNTAYGYTLNATVGQATNYETRNLVLANTSNNFTSLNFSDSLASLTTDNTWGYSYKPSGSSSWSNYSGLPLYSDTTNIATLIDTDQAAHSDSVQFKIAAKASNNQASGEYKNVINFIAVAAPEPVLGPVSCEAGKICYNANTLGSYEGEMTAEAYDAWGSTVNDGNYVVLLPPNFSRQGYGFAGWNTAYDYSGTYYGPTEVAQMPTGVSTNGLSLYAVWVKSAGYMQDFSQTNCMRMNSGDVTALTDERDGQTYAVAKLVDEKCWMIENLRIDNQYTTGSANIALSHGYDASFIGLASPEGMSAFGTTNANSLYSTNGSTTITISGNNLVDRFPRYYNEDTANRNETVYLSGQRIYGYGNYYTWPAGVANTSDINSASSIYTSICPSGWSLPSGGDLNSGSDFLRLGRVIMGQAPSNSGHGIYGYNDISASGKIAYSAFTGYPNNFILGGYIDGRYDYKPGLGRWSYYLTNTSDDGNDAYGFGIVDEASINPGTASIYKNSGYSARCVLINIW